MAYFPAELLFSYFTNFSIIQTIEMFKYSNSMSNLKLHFSSRYNLKGFQSKLKPQKIIQHFKKSVEMMKKPRDAELWRTNTLRFIRKKKQGKIDQKSQSI